MKKLLKKIKYDKKIMTILNVIIIIGIITGSIFITILSKNDKLAITNSINNYFNNTINSKISVIKEFENIFITNLIVILAIWIIGISVIGVPLIIIYMFYKAFIMGFTVSSLIYVYSYKGLLLSFVYIFPHMIINLIILIILSCYSMKLSSILIKSILKKETLNFKSFINNYLRLFLIISLFIFFTSLYESTLFPNILRYFLSIIL